LHTATDSSFLHPRLLNWGIPGARAFFHSLHKPLSFTRLLGIVSLLRQTFEYEALLQGVQEINPSKVDSWAGQDQDFDIVRTMIDAALPACQTLSYAWGADNQIETFLYRDGRIVLVNENPRTAALFIVGLESKHLYIITTFLIIIILY
jgi:hypothetical protein